MSIEEMKGTVREIAAGIRTTHTSAGYPSISIEEMKETVREITAGIRAHIPRQGIPG